MKLTRGISGFVATLVLVAISLSLSYVVYEGVSRFSPGRQEIFTNQVIDIGGSPEILEIRVNASSPGAPTALDADSASSQTGLLYFDGTSFGTTKQLCLPNATTFFSVYAETAGLLQAASNGRTWIDGHLTGSLNVGPGWHEVMFSDASSCEVRGTGGSPLTYPGGDVDSVPILGLATSSSFTLFIPTDGLSHSLVLVFEGGLDQLA